MKLTRDRNDGGFVVTCRDFPEAITQAETPDEAMLEAADCLEEAIAARIDDGRDIPMPTEVMRGEKLVSVPPSMALKAAVYSSNQNCPNRSGPFSPGATCATGACLTGTVTLPWNGEMTVAASVEPGRGCAEGDRPTPSATVEVTTFYPPQ